MGLLSASLLRRDEHDFIIHHCTFLEVHAGVVVCVDGLAEVDGVAELFLQHWLAGVARQFEQEEAGVGLGKVVVRGVVLVQNLWREGKVVREGRDEAGKG